MSIFDILRMANKNLWRRKMRTMLTVLGVVIGTASIIVMLSLGFGLNENQRENMARWGSLNIVRVNPSQAVDREGNPQEGAKVLDDEALAELAWMPGVVAISPAQEISGEVTWNRKEGYMPLVGLDVDQLEQLEFTLDYGEMITGEDSMKIIVGAQVVNNFRDRRTERSARQSTTPAQAAFGTGRAFPQGAAIIGGNMVQANIRRSMTGRGMTGVNVTQEDPRQLLGERITIALTNGRQETRKFHFTVVGILDEKNMDRAWQAYGSLEDVQKLAKFMQQGSSDQRRNKSGDNTYNYIMLRTDDVGKAKELSTALRDMGYNAQSMAESLDGIEQTSRVIQAVLGGIGSISLLVAALGITNTMVMSIYERTKEIGIIKVIGASGEDIQTMFLAEASLIGLVGGVIGLGLSYGASYIINKLAGSYINLGIMGSQSNISIIPSWLALFAVGFAMAIGLLAGVLPAGRALRLSPIEAIRQN